MLLLERLTGFRSEAVILRLRQPEQIMGGAGIARTGASAPHAFSASAAAATVTVRRCLWLDRLPGRWPLQQRLGARQRPTVMSQHSAGAGRTGLGHACTVRPTAARATATAANAAANAAFAAAAASVPSRSRLSASRARIAASRSALTLSISAPIAQPPAPLRR